MELSTWLLPYQNLRNLGCKEVSNLSMNVNPLVLCRAGEWLGYTSSGYSITSIIRSIDGYALVLRLLAILCKYRKVQEAAGMCWPVKIGYLVVVLFKIYRFAVSRDFTFCLWFMNDY